MKIFKVLVDHVDVVVVLVVVVVHTGRSGDRQRAVSVLCFW